MGIQGARIHQSPLPCFGKQISMDIIGYLSMDKQRITSQGDLSMDFNFLLSFQLLVIVFIRRAMTCFFDEHELKVRE